MDQTFITIHNLTPDANILFASDSITDILGFLPHEVQNKSCFDFFHPHEVPFARSIHRRGVRLDKAAVLHYARILSVDGRWVNCECCFTIVHDVLVACTSIYRRTLKSERRAIEAPQIRRLFSCSPRDPRYHMLEHLSPKFRMPAMEREPRAALILNRFTRSLSIMFSTDTVSAILGLSPQDLQDQSFYDCIQEGCLQEAVCCLEGAKANDSIAYLRFWSKDPRRPESIAPSECDDSTEAGTDWSVSPKMEEDQECDEGVRPLSSCVADFTQNDRDIARQSGASFVDVPSTSVKSERDSSVEDPWLFPRRSSSEPPVPFTTETSGRSPPAASRGSRSIAGSNHSAYPVPSVELEAVVSCTSDGLVVIIRRARPPVPGLEPPRPSYPDEGLFAAPWAQQPINPNIQPDCTVDGRYAMHGNRQHPRGPPLESLMRSIRDVAVFAWALVGINENIAMHGNGIPQAEAVPADWTPPSNGYPVHPKDTKTEDMHRSGEDCWVGCRCKAENPPVFGYPTGVRSSPSVGPLCSCNDCQLHEQSLPRRQSERQQVRGRLPVNDMRQRLRSHASTSSLPNPNSQWRGGQDGRSRRAGNWRSDAKRWPYPGF